jgi:acyl-CoA thioesterase-1
VRRVVFAACLLLAGLPVKAATPPTCPSMSDAEPVAESLPHLAAALKPGGTVDILAIGISVATPGLTPAGPVTSSGFVQLLGQNLQAAIPGLHVSLMAHGGRGQDAAAQLNLIRAALKQHRYAAVLWQTGTLDAVRSAPADTFYQSLSDGADLIADAGADLVLVEPQYSRFLEANADLSPYLAVMQAMDAARATLVFHRYDLMHAWADAGEIDLEQATRADRPAIAAKLQFCLAAELAHAILEGARGEALR